MADGQLTGPELIADDVFARLSKLDDALAKLILQLGSIESAAKTAFNTGQLNEQANRANSANKQANEIIKERARLERNLATLQERNRQATSQTSREIIRQRVEIQATNRNLKREETARNEVVGAYRRQSAQLNILKERYKDLAVEERQSTAEGRKLAAQIEVLQRRVRGADQAVGDFQRNVGNYKSAFSGVTNSIRSAIGALGILEGLRFGFRLLRDASEAERRARGVEFAFNRLGESGEQALTKVRAATRGLVSNLEIRRSLVEFDNFNISLEESATLFEFLAVRAAQTGRSIDDLRTSLVEGLSKESKLRIDNLGISAQELNEELEKTPNFVQAVANIAKRELKEAGSVLDEAANGAERLNAQYEDLEVNLGKILNSAQVYSTLSQITQGLSRASGDLNVILESNVSTFNKLVASFRFLTTSNISYNATIAEEITRRKELQQEIENQIDAYIRLAGSIGPLTQEQQRSISGGGGSIFTNPALAQEVAKSVGEINEEIRKQQDLLLNATDRAGAKAIQERIKALEDERDAILGVVEKEEERVNKVKGSIAFYQEYISKQEQLRDATATTTEEYDAFNRKIDETKGKLEALQGAYEDTFFFSPEPFKLSDLIDVDTSEQEAADLDSFLNTEGVAVAAENLAKILGENQADIIAEFEQGYERDYQNFLKYTKLKLDLAQEEKEARLQIAGDVLNGLDALGSSLFEIAEQRAEREVQLQNEAFDAIINSKNATEEQIEIAEKKREENEKRLQAEREKRQRQEFLLQQAIEVGKIFIADALARANATATSFTLPPGVAQGYLATALSLITTQTGIALATVLAQSLPQFFTGKSLMDNYEGLATWGERGREVRVTKEGNVEVSPNTTTPTFVSRDDLILKNIPLFNQSMNNPNSEVFKRVAGAWKSDTQTRTAPAGYNPARIERTIDQGLKRGFKGVQHRINIINKIDPQPRVRRY